MDRNKEKQEEKNIRESPQRRLEELERLRLQREREEERRQLQEKQVNGKQNRFGHYSL